MFTGMIPRLKSCRHSRQFRLKEYPPINLFTGMITHLKSCRHSRREWRLERIDQKESRSMFIESGHAVNKCQSCGLPPFANSCPNAKNGRIFIESKLNQSIQSVEIKVTYSSRRKFEILKFYWLVENQC